MEGLAEFKLAPRARVRIDLEHRYQRRKGETSMRITIRGLLVASALMTVGCANAIARHDVFERSDIRLGRAVSTARLNCQEQQPKKALPSAEEYERCVLDRLQRAELSVTRR
jgi:hypothetical protein